MKLLKEVFESLNFALKMGKNIAIVLQPLFTKNFLNSLFVVVEELGLDDGGCNFFKRFSLLLLPEEISVEIGGIFFRFLDNTGSRIVCLSFSIFRSFRKSEEKSEYIGEYNQKCQINISCI